MSWGIAMAVESPGKVDKVMLWRAAEAYRLTVYVDKSRHIILYVYLRVTLPVTHDLIPLRDSLRIDTTVKKRRGCRYDRGEVLAERS